MCILKQTKTKVQRDKIKIEIEILFSFSPLWIILCTPWICTVYVKTTKPSTFYIEISSYQGLEEERA